MKVRFRSSFVRDLKKVRDPAILATSIGAFLEPRGLAAAAAAKSSVTLRVWRPSEARTTKSYPGITRCVIARPDPAALRELNLCLEARPCHILALDCR